VLTQIYEVSTPEEARLISKIGVDHIGILIGNGEFPRELSIEVAAERNLGHDLPRGTIAIAESSKARNVAATAGARPFAP
jgi:hypothetical protein